MCLQRPGQSFEASKGPHKSAKHFVIESQNGQH